MTLVLIDLREQRGAIKVLNGDREIVAYAVPANASQQWAVWTHGGNGPRDWSHTIVADSDAALAALTEWVDKEQAGPGPVEPGPNGGLPTVGPPAVPDGHASLLPVRAVAHNVAGYVVLIGGLLGLAQLGGWAMGLVGAP